MRKSVPNAVTITEPEGRSPSPHTPAPLPNRDGPFGGRAAGVAAYLVLQLGLIYIVLQAYSYLRKTFFQRSSDPAFRNALDVIDAQAFFGLSVERVELPLQARVLEHAWLVDAVNAYYRGLKPGIYLAIVLAILFAPAGFRRVRRLFFLATLVALPWYAIYPLAPPRFMEPYGYPIVDTLAVHGGTVSSSGGMGGANQFAAMPSMHIGWSVVVALWLAVSLRRWWIGAILGTIHVLLMSLTVMATGNHFWLDIVGGFAVVAAAVALDRVLPPLPSFALDRGRAVRIGGTTTDTSHAGVAKLDRRDVAVVARDNQEKGIGHASPG